MSINPEAKTKEEIIPFLEKIGFVLITDDDEIRRHYYQYVDKQYSIRIFLESKGLGRNILIQLRLFKFNSIVDAVAKNNYIEKEAIEFLNTKFKYQLRKIIIDKLLNL